MEDLDFVSPIGALSHNPVYAKNPPCELSVVVRNAVTPFNFQVTDYYSSQALERLEASMIEWYTAYDKTNHHLSHDDLELGGFYAVKYVTEEKPEKWLRCEIVKPFKKELTSVTAKLVDSGAFYHTVPENFQKLRKPYCSLPIQALEAALHASNGIKPGDRNVGAEECRRFYERVEGKKFYAFLVNSVESLQRRESLRLILVDTSDPVNRYIHEEFNLKIDPAA